MGQCKLCVYSALEIDIEKIDYVTKRHCNNQSERSFQIGPIRAWRNVSIQPIRQQEANLSADGAQDGGGQLHAAKLTLLIANCLQIMVFQSVPVGKTPAQHNLK